MSAIPFLHYFIRVWRVSLFTGHQYNMLYVPNRTTCSTYQTEKHAVCTNQNHICEFCFFWELTNILQQFVVFEWSSQLNQKCPSAANMVRWLHFESRNSNKETTAVWVSKNIVLPLPTPVKPDALLLLRTSCYPSLPSIALIITNTRDGPPFSKLLSPVEVHNRLLSEERINTLPQHGPWAAIMDSAQVLGCARFTDNLKRNMLVSHKSNT